MARNADVLVQEAYRARPPDLVRDSDGINGRPLSVRELAEKIGMSATFIRTEIRCGHLRASMVGRGRRRVFRIMPREARRYAKSLGLL